MARVIPDGWQALELVGAAQREIETLHALAALPDGYTVVHGVHWTRVEHGASIYGEIDFAVVAPNGRLLVVEQKSGMLDETADGLVKSYGTLKKRVAPQIVRSVEGLMARFKHARRPADERLAIDYLLYCPDYHVRDAGRAGIAPERIVDTTRADRLAAIVVDVLSPEPAAGAADAATVLRFLSDELALVADVATLIGRSDAWVTRLSGGLAHWARQLDFEPFRLRVRGTAGSGKTQLALAVLRDAAEAGLRALYVCFNRPLADHIARIVATASHDADTRILATTFHGLGDRLLRATGHEPDFSAPGLYARFEEAVATATVNDPFDVLVVDEGQDFAPAWRDAVLRFVKPEGRAYWLEDPLQNLYARAPVDLPREWVTLHARTNYRSPRDILASIVPLLARGRPSSEDTRTLLAIEAASPLAGSELEIATWNDGDDTGEAASRALSDATMRAITRALAAGYRRADIVVLTFAGRDHSRLLALDALGPHALRRFTGTYDLFGNPDYSDGEVLVETIYRFKGQSAPCIVFTEIDFDALDDKVVRKLFVGATRATTKLMLVMSERAARICLGDDGPAE